MPHEGPGFVPQHHKKNFLKMNGVLCSCPYKGCNPLMQISGSIRKIVTYVALCNTFYGPELSSVGKIAMPGA
jgi:hypothetical protein